MLSKLFPQLFHKPSTDALDGKLLLLASRVANLESENKRLRSEWEDLFDKLMHRLERERKRAMKKLDPEPMAEPASGLENAAGALSHEQIFQMARASGIIR